MRELAVGGVKAFHRGDPLLAFVANGEANAADAFKRHLFVSLSDLSCMGREGVEAIAPKLLDAFGGIFSQVVVIAEMVGEFVVGFGRARPADFDGGLPEIVIHNV